MQRERSRTNAPPAAVYAERADRFDREATDQQRTVRLYGRLRLALFTASTLGAWWLFASGRGTPAWLLLAAAAALFVVFVARQQAARLRMRRAELMAGFNREGIARIARSWPELRPWPIAPSVPGLAAPRDHDYADDLDLYGHASLLHLTGVCGTPPGWRTLQEWLLGSADPKTVALRQDAVSEMAGAFDFRDGLAAETRLAAIPAATRLAPTPATTRLAPAPAAMRHGPPPTGTRPAPVTPETPEDSFLRWAEGDPWLPKHRWLRAASLVLPPINAAAITLYSLGMVPIPALVWPLLISAVVLVPRWRGIHAVFDEADDGESGVRRYSLILGHLRDAPLESRYLAALRERVGAGPPADAGRAGGPRPGPATERRTAPEEITALRRLLDMAEARRSPLVHIPLALMFFWDVRVLAGLERWKARSGRRVRGWLEAVGEAEALAALAALAADNPGWTMPTLHPDARTLRARGLGHPLLSPQECIHNDVEIGPAGSFLLVTGSNMSGKSTLLRATGLNAVLAQAGGPVCAEELRMPPLRVMTSIHIEDSLADGVSYFLAGLQRLKRVVDAAGGPRPRTLYLLDEILQGTNSAERRIAARTVLRRLLVTGAIGAVTTHDLTLADADDLAERATAVHFTESFEGGDAELTFDYRLRDGITTSTNALRLLALAGLGDGDDSRDP